MVPRASVRALNSAKTVVPLTCVVVAWWLCGCGMGVVWVMDWVLHGVHGGVWVGCGLGVGVVWVWYGCGVGVVWVWYGCGMDVVWVWCGCGVGVVWVVYGDVWWCMGGVWVWFGCGMGGRWWCMSSFVGSVEIVDSMRHLLVRFAYLVW